MIVVINGKHYPTVHLDQLSLKHTLVLQRELAVSNISSASTWPEVKSLVEEFQGLNNDERLEHPEGMFLMALTIWAARVTAGEDLTLLDAVDVPLTQVRFVSEPTDRDAGPVGKGQPRVGGAKRKTSGKKSNAASSS